MLYNGSRVNPPMLVDDAQYSIFPTAAEISLRGKFSLDAPVPCQRGPLS